MMQGGGIMNNNYYKPAIRQLKRWKGKYTQEEILIKANRLRIAWGIFLIIDMIVGLWVLTNLRIRLL